MVALAGDNAPIHETLSQLHIHVRLFRLDFHAAATIEANEKHARIVAAIRNHDPVAVEAAMRDHIERFRLRFQG